MKETLDRRRKYYLVLDCETATLPCAANYDDPAIKQKIAIAKPLIYDLGWKVIDAQGRVYRRRSFLITEIFSVPAIFNTAYYAWKRPIYLERLTKGETELKSWKDATEILLADLAEIESTGAYNSMFDFKKAIPFTELYINMLFSPHYYEWEEMQNGICEDIASGNRRQNDRDFDPMNFRFRGTDYPLFDIWGLACETLLNNDDFREAARGNGWKTASGKYFSTSAETAFRYLKQNYDFSESHTAVDDADIESEILSMYFKKVKPKKMTMGIIYFPFKILGKYEEEE